MKRCRTVHLRPTSFFSACFLLVLFRFMPGFPEGVPEFTQVLFSHCTKEDTKAWGSGFLGSSIFIEKSEDWNSCPLTWIPELFPQH